ncbi:MAG: acyl-CoA dehydrogenase family protein [Terriglobales bacterium]
MNQPDTARPANAAPASFVLGPGDPAEIFTPEDFSDQHRLIAQTAEQFARQEVLPKAEELEHQDFAATRALLKKAAELGLTAIDIPESYGGLGLDFASSTLVYDRLAKYASFSVSFGGHTGIGMLPILYFGTEDQKRRYLPKLAASEWIGAYALSEASSGSDALAARARADLEPDGKHYLLNGEKMWITNAAFADLFTVFAKVAGEKFTAFLVEKDFPGVSVGAEENKMGIKGSSTRSLILNNARVPTENVLGEVGKGHHIAFNILNVGRFKLGAGCAGGARTALEQAVAYAKQRRGFGRPIAEFGLVAQMLADMALGVYACESAVYRAVGLIDHRLESIDKDAADAPAQIRRALEAAAVECSIVKVFGSEMLDRAVDANVQIHGGYGFVREYPAERGYRDSRVNRIFEGTNEINRLLITGMLLRRAMKGELPLLAEVNAITQELMSAVPGGAAAAAGGEPLAAEMGLIEGVRKLALLLAGAAFQKYREGLEQEQEVLAGLADLIIHVFVLQSAILRARKMTASGRRHASLAQAMSRVLAVEGLDRCEAVSHRLLPHVAEGDLLRAQAAMARRLLKRDLAEVIAPRRDIARAAVEAGRYPLD